MTDCLNNELQIGDYVLVPGTGRYKNLHLAKITALHKLSVSCFAPMISRGKINNLAACVKITEEQAIQHNDFKYFITNNLVNAQ